MFVIVSHGLGFGRMLFLTSGFFQNKFAYVKYYYYFWRMRIRMNQHSQLISKIFVNSDDTWLRSSKHTISDSFREWFCFFIAWLHSMLCPQTDSLFSKKAGTSSKYIYLAKVGAMLTLVTSDVINFNVVIWTNKPSHDAVFECEVG